MNEIVTVNNNYINRKEEKAFELMLTKGETGLYISPSDVIMLTIMGFF